MSYAYALAVADGMEDASNVCTKDQPVIKERFALGAQCIRELVVKLQSIEAAADAAAARDTHQAPLEIPAFLRRQAD